MLTDEELEQVAGGNVGRTAADSKLLYEHGLMDTYYGDFGLLFSWVSKSKNVDAGWAKAGITCVTHWINENKYFKDGNEISQEEAYKIIEDNYPKIRSAGFAV